LIKNNITLNIIMNAILMVGGIKKELEGQRDQALANLKIYLTTPVGVGEHSDISAEVKTLLAKIGECDSILDTIDKYIQEVPNESIENLPVKE
jgi:selenophosphate synthase